MTVYVLGLDVGFATFGWCLVELLPDGERVDAMGVITTAKSNRKQNVLASSDDHARGKSLVRHLEGHFVDASVVCAEAPSLPRNASAAYKIGRAWGVVDTLCVKTCNALVQASPQQIKQAVCGSKTATKEQVQRSLAARFDDRVIGFDSEPLSPPRHARTGLDVIDRFIVETRRTLHEHAFDALGAVVACLDSEVIRAIRPRAQRTGDVTQCGMCGESVRIGYVHPCPAAAQRTGYYCPRCGVAVTSDDHSCESGMHWKCVRCGRTTRGRENDHECTPGMLTRGGVA